MTDKEIRLELAKAALMGGASKERMEMVLGWVVGGKSVPSIDLDDVKASELSQHLGVSSVRFENRCRENDIHTVGQLVRIGSKQFRTLRLVGGDLCNKVGAVLKKYYGVEDW